MNEPRVLLRDAEDRPRQGPIELAEWDVPANLRVRGDELEWDPSLPGTQPSRRALLPRDAHAQQGVLQEFWTIAEAALADSPTPDDRTQLWPTMRCRTLILDFAKRWGPLGLCPHFRANRHCDECSRRGWELHGLPFSTLPDRGTEPLAGWIVWSLHSLYVARIAAAVEAEEAPRRADVVFLFGILEALDSPWAERFQPLHARPAALQQLVINEWLEMGDVGVRMRWESERPRLYLHSSGLLGALGVLLAAAVAGSPGIWICHACAMPHFRQRAPKDGARVLCDRQACRRASWRDSKARRKKPKEGQT